MDILAGIGHGFVVALQPVNLLYCSSASSSARWSACCWDRPCLGHVAAAAGDPVRERPKRPHRDGRHLLRLDVWRLDNLCPGQRSGEAASVVTCLDGHEMAKQGHTGRRWHCCSRLIRRARSPSSR